MVKAETLQKVSQGTLAGSGVAFLLGPGVFPFPVSGGGFFGGESVLFYGLPHAFKGNFQPLNPFGGYTSYEASNLHVTPQGLNVTWTPEFHHYTAAAGFDVAMGEAALSLLAVGAVTGIAGALMKRRAARHA